MPRNNYTLEDCIKVAKSHNGLCLSNEYINSYTKMKWKCEKGHIWETTFKSINNKKHWCKLCGIDTVRKKISNSLDKAILYAKEKGGACLSKIFVHQDHKLKWKCNCGNIWESSYRSVIHQKTWCPECKIKTKKTHKKITIEDCKKIAIEKGGECLSLEVIDSQTLLKWKCQNNHEWLASFGRIKYNNAWCKECLKITIEDCYELAKNHEGMCLETMYKNASIKIKWKCKNNHEFESSYNSIKRGRWCHECIKNTIEDCHKLAENNNGKCISEKYIDCHSKLQWECSKKHIWMASYLNVKHGTWCPNCRSSGSLQEKICNKILSLLFKKQFIKIRPDWLKNDKTGFNLEIDMFNEELKICVEYAGEQHFRFVALFHGSLENFEYLQYKDKLKETLVKEHGMHFIVVPYTVTKYKIIAYLVEKCKELNIEIEPYDEIEIKKEIDEFIKTIR